MGTLLPQCTCVVWTCHSHWCLCEHVSSGVNWPGLFFMDAVVKRLDAQESTGILTYFVRTTFWLPENTHLSTSFEKDCFPTIFRILTDKTVSLRKTMFFLCWKQCLYDEQGYKKVYSAKWWFFRKTYFIRRKNMFPSDFNRKSCIFRWKTLFWWLLVCDSKKSVLVGKLFFWLI